MILLRKLNINDRGALLSIIHGKVIGS